VRRHYDAVVDECTGVERLLELVRARGVEGATADDDLMALGLTSLQLLQLDADIEREFSIAVDPEVMLTTRTVGELAKRLLRP